MSIVSAFKGWIKTQMNEPLVIEEVIDDSVLRLLQLFSDEQLLTDGDARSTMARVLASIACQEWVDRGCPKGAEFLGVNLAEIKENYGHIAVYGRIIPLVAKELDRRLAVARPSFGTLLAAKEKSEPAASL